MYNYALIYPCLKICKVLKDLSSFYFENGVISFSQKNDENNERTWALNSTQKNHS